MKLKLLTSAMLLSLSPVLLVTHSSLGIAEAEPVVDDGMSAAMNVTATDKEFFRKAAIGGMTEVSAGKLASEKGSKDSVKAFGKRMVDDHGKANDQLQSLAERKKVALPTELDATHQAKLDALKSKSGSAFDEAFITAMNEGHADAIATFTAARQSKDPDVAKFASATLPTLQDHATHIPRAAPPKAGM